MIGVTDGIVGLWFLPVVLYIVLPLTMLCCWLVWRIVNPQKYRGEAATGRETEATSPESPVKAGGKSNLTGIHARGYQP